MRSIGFAGVGLAAVLLSGCATTPAGYAQAERDPLESFNRGVYGFNKGVDKVVLKPAATVYRTVTPVAARRGLTNVFNNVDEPFSFINALLQGKPRQALRTFARFAINTVLGVGGLADHATDMGLPEEPEDIGQTLAVWGVNSGPYLMLPLLGPSTLRDATGTGAEFLGADPYRHFPKEIGLNRTERWVLTGVELINTRSELIDTADRLLQGSLDEYATVRSAYLQTRLNSIYDGAPPEVSELPLTSEEPGEGGTAADLAAPDPAATPADPASTPVAPTPAAPAPTPPVSPAPAPTPPQG